MAASQNWKFEVVKILKEHGADPNQLSGRQSPRMWIDGMSGKAGKVIGRDYQEMRRLLHGQSGK
jgi:hypothetical protein